MSGKDGVSQRNEEKTRTNSRQKDQMMCYRHSRSRKSTVKTKEDDFVVPANIRHKYGSSVVEQLTSREQVQSVLKKSEEKQRTHVYQIPVLMKPMQMGNKYEEYYEIGHCLRANIFPGMSVRMCSLVQDSYTAEVNRRGITDINFRRHWHGKKKDDLATWSEMSIRRMAVNKNLEELFKSTSNSHAYPRISMKPSLPSPPPPSPKPPPQSKNSKKRLRQKAKKQQTQPRPKLEFRKDEDFWDFYDKPII